jgi:hypothetical protein
MSINVFSVFSKVFLCSGCLIISFNLSCDLLDRTASHYNTVSILVANHGVVNLRRWSIFGNLPLFRNVFITLETCESKRRATFQMKIRIIKCRPVERRRGAAYDQKARQLSPRTKGTPCADSLVPTLPGKNK